MSETSEQLVLKLISELEKSDLESSELLISKLKDRLKIEGFSNIIEESFPDLLESLHLKNINSAKTILRQILSNLRYLDVQLIKSFIYKSNTSLNKIQAKNLYVLMGPTGAGKSTSLHYLAGAKFILNKEYQLVPVEIKQPDLEEVIISSSINSETKTVIPIFIDFEQDTVIVCDTPGFGDTNGAEIDIVNILTMKKLLIYVLV